MGEFSGKKTPGNIESVVLAGALEGNVLPLTSGCNVCCLFCSHRQNPPEVEVFHIAFRSVPEVEKTLSYMDPRRPIVIGESATRIIEGEPFTHPAITEVLRLVRAAFPETTVRITTNGSLLDEKTVDLLSRLGNIEVCLSLNSCSEAGRALLMGDVNPGCAIKSAELMKEFGVPFHGSIVAMPHVVGWMDLESTVKYLCSCGAKTVRVFLPGFTALSAPALRFEHTLWKELHKFILRLRKETGVPLTCEPPLITDLKPEVTGVMAFSPAARAGLRAGDVIEAVDGQHVLTRVHAFNLIMEAGSPELVIMREGNKKLTLRVDKGPGERAGVVMDYDMDPGLIRGMNRAARRRGVSSVLVLTSELAYPVVSAGLRRFWKGKVDVEAAVVKNNFFGGSIKAAGLLTVDDFGAALEKYFRERAGKRTQLVILPGRAFDLRGRDLTGKSYLELKKRFGVHFEIL